jgi:putative transposase
MSKRRTHSPEFKAKVAMEAISVRRSQIFHSDQGCQFTASAFSQRLKAEEIKISW